ncbi:hypothetical protein Tco_1096769 [Tanacetum coccineum]
MSTFSINGKYLVSGLRVYKFPLRRVARPKIEDKDNFELKFQFIKELRDNTFSGSDHEDANEHIEKVLEIVDLFHIPNITIDQVMLRAFPMSLTGATSHWLRNKPSGLITTWEDLKIKFLSKYCSPARTANKMEEINNFQQEPDESLYQAWERFKELLMKQILDSRGAIPSKTAANAKVVIIRKWLTYSQNGTWTSRTMKEIKKANEKVYAAKVGCKQCKGPHYTKDYPLKEEGKTIEEAYYTQFGTPFQGGGYKATALGFYQRNNVYPSYQERRNQGSSIITLEIQIGKMSKVLQEIEFGSLPSLTETNPRDHVKSISTIVKADSYPIRPYSEASHINNSIPKKEKDPGIFTLPCFINNVYFDNALVDLGASISVMPLLTYLNLGFCELAHTKLIVELADRTVKYLKGIAENVLVRIGKFVFPIDFIIIDMPEDIKVPLILGRPFLSTVYAKIDVFKRKITLRVGEEKIIFKSAKLASSVIKRVYMLGLRERMEHDLEARLMGETLLLNRSLDPFFGDYIELNDLNVPLELRRDQIDDLIPTIKEGEVIEEFRSRNDARIVSKVFGYPSDCDHDKKIRMDCAYNLKFSCMIVLEDMDAYRDEGMGDVIFGEPFLREVGINANRFDGKITIHNGNEEVAYQMVRSHSRFKHHTNEQCNKIPPLLKVSEEDKMSGISHSYQKLKSFYKGVLNLGPEYVRDAKMEEWLTHGYISVHEME